MALPQTFGQIKIEHRGHSIPLSLAKAAPQGGYERVPTEGNPTRVAKRLFSLDALSGYEREAERAGLNLQHSTLKTLRPTAGWSRGVSSRRTAS